MKTDEDSIYLALNRVSDCGPRPFAIFLDNDMPVMWGIANLDVHDPKRARLEFVQLGDEAVAIHEKLLAERFSNEPTACWSKLPLPAPPVTRVARRDEVLREEAPPAPPVVVRPRSRVRLLHALAIAVMALFASSWLAGGDVTERAVPATPAAVTVDTDAASSTSTPVITPLELPLDEPAARVVTDDSRQTKRRETRRRRR